MWTREEYKAYLAAERAHVAEIKSAFLGLNNTGARNSLWNLGARSVDDVCKFTERELLAAYCFGPKSLRDVKAWLAQLGRRLKDAEIDLLRPATRNELAKLKAADPVAARSIADWLTS